MIKGKNIDLRIMNETDVELFCELSNDYSTIGEYYRYFLRTESETRKWILENNGIGENGGRFLITTKEDQIIGLISYGKGSMYMEGFELGYRIFKSEHYGKGYTTEAVKLISAFLFETSNITRLQICMNMNHIASAKIAENAGYTFEGIDREVLYLRGELVSHKRYSMVRSESKKLERVISEL